MWDDCVHLFACESTLKEKLEKLQNRAARIITGASYDVRSTDLLHALSLENLNNRHRINKTILTFRILHNHSASNPRDKFDIRETNLGSYNLRNFNMNVSVPKPNTEYLKRSFGYSLAVLWNSLPTQAKQTESFLKI